MMTLAEMQAIFDVVFSLIITVYCLGLGIGLIVKVMKQALK